MINNKKNKILILGGTEFVGRQLVEDLSKDSSTDLYLFNRGKTNADLFPNVHRIIGDRETKDIEQLKQHQWDYVIDFSSYFPKSLSDTLKVINQDVKKYIYISTISVYDFSKYGEGEIEETFPKKSYTETQLVEPSLKYYGEKKMACEDVLANAKWLPAIILRPNVIYGKYDPTDRFYYWLRRIKKEKHLLVPDSGKFKMTLSYSEDLVELIKACIAGEIPNDTYNCSTHEPIALIEALEMMKELLNSQCQLDLVDGAWLKEEGVKPQGDMPLWYGKSLITSNAKLINQTGFKCQSFKASMQSTINYYEKENWRFCKAGMSREQEEVLIGKIRE